jgi:hypothetical protein
MAENNAIMAEMLSHIIEIKGEICSQGTTLGEIKKDLVEHKEVNKDLDKRVTRLEDREKKILWMAGGAAAAGGAGGFGLGKQLTAILAFFGFH